MRATEHPTWQRHRPETTSLYAIVRDHLGAFTRFAEESYSAALPKYVRRAFEQYLRCGILEHGFVRVRCDACRKDRLVAFSCKQRGPCPSCSARVMCNTAAHLTDRVLPNVPIRQWVLSLPFNLRIATAREPSLLAACDRILIDAIFRWMGRRLATRNARGGAVTFVQRFGGSLNLHVHFHVLVLDGVFVRNGAHPVFHAAPAPTPLDLASVLGEVRARVKKWIAAHAIGARSRIAPDALGGCTQLAVQPGLFTDLGRSSPLGDDELSNGAGRKSASLDGFNLHAAVRIGADDDVGREQLVRYCARPPFALERLSVLRDGRIAYAIKTARRGATHRILTPVELLARIAALIPPPRHPFLRYHGVLAPASKWRAEIVPREVALSSPNGASGATRPACAHESTSLSAVEAPRAAPSSARQRKCDGAKPSFSPLWQRPGTGDAVRVPNAITEVHRSRLLGGALLATTPRLDWAKLIRRTYLVDVLICPQCRGPTRVLGAITDPPVIRRILAHLHEPPARAPPSGAHEPMFDDDIGVDLVE